MSFEYLIANPFWKLSKQLEKTESLQKMFYFINVIARGKYMEYIEARHF